ncbi:MAG: hypothetical protein IPO67_10090 [Deltaproteobacteria bacterium]|nr:hypothetical protein [Deltaproteobacteria bacterium]
MVDEHERFLGVVTERDIVGAYYHEVLRRRRAPGACGLCEPPAKSARRATSSSLRARRWPASRSARGWRARAWKVLALPARFGPTRARRERHDPTTGLLVRRHIDATHKLKVGDRLVVLGPEDGVRRLREQNAAAFESGADDATEEINHHRPKDG